MCKEKPTVFRPTPPGDDEGCGLVLLVVHQSVDGSNQNNFGVGGLIILFFLMLELKDKLLARRELEAGHAVQQALMPERTPRAPGWGLWLFTRSANEVGGLSRLAR